MHKSQSSEGCRWLVIALSRFLDGTRQRMGALWVEEWERERYSTGSFEAQYASVRESLVSKKDG